MTPITYSMNFGRSVKLLLFTSGNNAVFDFTFTNIIHFGHHLLFFLLLVTINDFELFEMWIWIVMVFVISGVGVFLVILVKIVIHSFFSFGDSLILLLVIALVSRLLA